MARIRTPLQIAIDEVNSMSKQMGAKTKVPMDDGLAYINCYAQIAIAQELGRVATAVERLERTMKAKK